MPLQIVIPVGTGLSVGDGITTYSGLVTTLGEWLNRSDLGGKIPVFIALLEARLNRILRTPDMEEIVTLPLADGETAVDLPTDFLEARHLYINGDVDYELSPKSLSILRSEYPVSNGARPVVYAIADGQIEVAPASATDLTLHYYQKIPALSAANETNWLIVSHPDVYLYGALVMAEAFIWDDERMERVWKPAWDEALGELMSHGRKKRHGGGPLYPTAPSHP